MAEFPVVGIDVSHHQGLMDWDLAKQMGITFAFIRAEYNLAKDKQFDRNWSEAKRCGIYRGAYGWVMGNPISNVNQYNHASFFWNIIKNEPGELPPVCDFEQGTYGSGISTPAFGALQAYMLALEGLCGKKPLLYTSRGYWTRWAPYASQYWALNYPLWIAHYTGLPQPTLPKPFTEWRFWQWSADLNKLGEEYGAQSVSIDLNRYNGNMESFLQFVGNETPTPPPSPDLETRVTKLEAWAKLQGYKP